MGALEIGQSVHANDLTLPEGVELVAHIQHENPAVATITLPKGMKSDEAAPEAPAAPAA
jgi:large subunit ribosomal protein L25